MRSIRGGGARRRPQVFTFRRSLALLAAMAILPIPAGAANGAARGAAPNIVLITVDTLRADHLSSYGYHLKTSPNIDKLASEGTRFEKAYTAIPLTGPAHITMLTSRYPQEHGGRINGVSHSDDARLLFLPQILRKFSYRTAAFVSAWPLVGRLTRLNAHFDRYDEDLTRTYQLLNSSRWAEDVTPKAIEWMKQNREGPFFLWVHYFDPHSPYQLREGFGKLPRSGNPQRRNDRRDPDLIRRYNSEVAYTDHYIGKLMAAVDQQAGRESTLVVLTADHGESLGEHGYVGHGRRLYESIVRVPLIVRWPGVVKAGQVARGRVSLVDLTPTIVDVTLRRSHPDLELPVPLGGQGFGAALAGGPPMEERTIRYLTFAGKKGFVPRFLSFLWTHLDDRPLWVGQLTGNRKVLWSPQGESMEIFDLGADPYEKAPAKPKRTTRIYEGETARLQHWYDFTSGASGENRMTSQDIEALKSLGYLQ
ncbi:MAG: sulfatase [Bryobacteraceae bacterium]|nr:sulfatase [Bryobacteraceae bacterium]